MSEDETRPQPDPWLFPGATAPVDAIGSDDSQLPPTPARSARMRRGVVTAAVVVLALGAAGAAGAALARNGGSDQPSFSSAAATSSPSASGGEGQRVGPKALKHFMRGGPGMLGGGLMGLAGALHGELVVPDGNGGYKTVVVQRGKTTSVSDTSITVKSDDGFTQTYAVGSAAGVGAQREGLASIKNGANVVVTGEKKGGSVTADHVIDMDSFTAGGFGRFGGPGDGDGPGAPQPAPTGTAGSSNSSFGV
jgi:hypothetical protein